MTFEHQEEQRLGYDKVIMLAMELAMEFKIRPKKMPKKGDMIVILGGDNYRIGMGGAAVSSANTGAFSNEIELNAVQRSNPEIQKEWLIPLGLWLKGLIIPSFQFMIMEQGGI